jgi:hypothetical protein
VHHEEKETSMHRNRTDRFIRRLVILALLAAGIAVGTLAPGRAGAATRTTERPVRDRSAQLLDVDDAGAGLATPGSDTPVLADFTPEPAGDHGGVALFQAPAADGLTIGSLEGPGPAPSPDHYLAGEGCSIQCITGGVAHARGVGAHVEVTTHTQATITIFVQGPGFDGWAQSDPGRIDFGHHFADLLPGQTYHVTAVAMDGGGHVSVAEGDLVTLERHVTISMSHAIVAEHQFASSVFAKSQWVDGSWAPAHSYEGMSLQQGGAVVWVEEEIDLAGVDRYLDLAVRLLERQDHEDCDTAFALPWDEGLTAGSADCRVWAFAELAPGEDDLDARPADATSWVEHTLERTLVLPGGDDSLPGGFAQPLEFTVDVTLHVTYQQAT